MLTTPTRTQAITADQTAGMTASRAMARPKETEIRVSLRSPVRATRAAYSPPATAPAPRDPMSRL
jgi:hypothetical protein